MNVSRRGREKRLNNLETRCLKCNCNILAIKSWSIHASRNAKTRKVFIGRALNSPLLTLIVCCRTRVPLSSCAGSKGHTYTYLVSLPACLATHLSTCLPARLLSSRYLSSFLLTCQSTRFSFLFKYSDKAYCFVFIRHETGKEGWVLRLQAALLADQNTWDTKKG